MKCAVCGAERVPRFPVFHGRLLHLVWVTYIEYLCLPCMGWTAAFFSFESLPWPSILQHEIMLQMAWTHAQSAECLP